MRYATNGISGIRPDKPMRVYDAAGDPILGCTFCDTETGEVERPVEIRETTTPKLIREFRPAPLKVVWLRK